MRDDNKQQQHLRALFKHGSSTTSPLSLSMATAPPPPLHSLQAWRQWQQQQQHHLPALFEHGSSSNNNSAITSHSLFEHGNGTTTISPLFPSMAAAAAPPPRSPDLYLLLLIKLYNFCT
jgi:hypothetical protein